MNPDTEDLALGYPLKGLHSQNAKSKTCIAQRRRDVLLRINQMNSPAQSGDQNQDFVALACENHFKVLWVLSRKAGNYSWFPLPLCVSAREQCLYGGRVGR